jgi:hypothetical protein
MLLLPNPLALQAVEVRGLVVSIEVMKSSQAIFEFAGRWNGSFIVFESGTVTSP